MRSHYCGALSTDNIDETVTLCGWVDRRRDHGGVIFLDLRDQRGIVQVVYDPDTEEHFQRADRVRSEYVLKVTGRVRARSEATVNSAMSTGEIEVLGKELEILNTAATPPFQLDEFTNVDLEFPQRWPAHLRSGAILLQREFRSRLSGSCGRVVFAHLQRLQGDFRGRESKAAGRLDDARDHRTGWLQLSCCESLEQWRVW